jgi:hypothetical protein
MDSSVSEEHTASIFRVKLNRVKIWLDCIGRLQEWSSLRPVGRGEEAESL